MWLAACPGKKRGGLQIVPHSILLLLCSPPPPPRRPTGTRGHASNFGVGLCLPFGFGSGWPGDTPAPHTLFGNPGLGERLGSTSPDGPVSLISLGAQCQPPQVGYCFWNVSSNAVAAFGSRRRDDAVFLVSRAGFLAVLGKRGGLPPWGRRQLRLAVRLPSPCPFVAVSRFRVEKNDAFSWLRVAPEFARGHVYRRPILLVI